MSRTAGPENVDQISVLGTYDRGGMLVEADHGRGQPAFGGEVAQRRQHCPVAPVDAVIAADRDRGCGSLGNAVDPISEDFHRRSEYGWPSRFANQTRIAAAR